MKEYKYNATVSFNDKDGLSVEGDEEACRKVWEMWNLWIKKQDKPNDK